MLQMMDGHDMHQVFSIGNLKEIFVKGGSMDKTTYRKFEGTCIRTTYVNVLNVLIGHKKVPSRFTAISVSYVVSCVS